jgi:hypothetical protein
MRTRANFGVIGNTRTILTSTVGGMFSVDDQRVAKQELLWPTLIPQFSINYLIVAGGGGGGGNIGGGGGAGGYRTNYGLTPILLAPSTVYTVTVGGGGGGAPATSNPWRGTNGGVSSLVGGAISIESAGGGAGAGYSNNYGNSGGSGGGANAGAAGGNNAGGNGTVNTGGGGGGASFQTGFVAGGSGGSGVVIISVPTTNYSGTTTGSPTVTTSGSNTIIKFTSSGTL